MYRIANIQARVKLCCIAMLCGLLLSSCGFHLRGSKDFSAQVKSIFIDGTPRYSDLGRELRRAFSGVKVNVVEDKFDAELVLLIKQDQKGKRVLSLSSSGQANQYELSYQLQFLVLNKAGEERLPIQTIKLLREYSYDPNLILAMVSEEQRLQQDMLRQAVDQLLRRLSFSLAQPAAKTPASSNDKP